MPWRIHLSATVEAIKEKIGPFPVNQLQYFGVGCTCFPCSWTQACILPKEPHSGNQGAFEDQVQNSMTWDKRTSLKNNQPELASEPQSKSNTWSFEKFKRLQERQNHLPLSFLFRGLIIFFFNTKKYFPETARNSVSLFGTREGQNSPRGGLNL